MHGYICFYKNKRFEVYADTSYQAQQKVAKEQKIKKAYEITVVLAELNGKPVAHKTSDIG